jgi:hypothetical protein
MKQGPVPEGPQPLLRVAALARFQRDVPVDASGVLSLHVAFTRPVANLTAGVLEFGRLLDTDESSRLPITRGVTEVALLHLVTAQSFLHALNTAK